MNQKKEYPKNNLMISYSVVKNQILINLQYHYYIFKSYFAKIENVTLQNKRKKSKPLERIPWTLPAELDQISLLLVHSRC